MSETFVFALAAGIGVVAGLRSLLAPAAVAWAAHLGWLHLQGTLLGFMASKSTVVTLSLLAIGELIADKLPRVPNRTAAAPLLARVLSGSFCGVCLCASAHQAIAVGAAVGSVSGAMGAFAGYKIRRWLASRMNIRDPFIALLEDLAALGLASFFVSR